MTFDNIESGDHRPTTFVHLSDDVSGAVPARTAKADCASPASRTFHERRSLESHRVAGTRGGATATALRSCFHNPSPRLGCCPKTRAVADRSQLPRSSTPRSFPARTIRCFSRRLTAWAYVATPKGDQATTTRSLLGPWSTSPVAVPRPRSGVLREQTTIPAYARRIALNGQVSCHDSTTGPAKAPKSFLSPRQPRAFDSRPPRRTRAWPTEKRTHEHVMCSLQPTRDNPRSKPAKPRHRTKRAPSSELPEGSHPTHATRAFGPGTEGAAATLRPRHGSPRERVSIPLAPRCVPTRNVEHLRLADTTNAQLPVPRRAPPHNPLRAFGPLQITRLRLCARGTAPRANGRPLRPMQDASCPTTDTVDSHRRRRPVHRHPGGHHHSTCGGLLTPFPLATQLLSNHRGTATRLLSRHPSQSTRAFRILPIVGIAHGKRTQVLLASRGTPPPHRLEAFGPSTTGRVQLQDRGTTARANEQSSQSTRATSRPRSIASRR